MKESGAALDLDAVHSYMPNALGGADANLPASGAITAANPRPVPTFGRVVVQKDPAIDFRLHNIVIHPVTQIRMGPEHLGWKIGVHEGHPIDDCIIHP